MGIEHSRTLIVAALQLKKPTTTHCISSVLVLNIAFAFRISWLIENNYLCCEFIHNKNKKASGKIGSNSIVMQWYFFYLPFKFDQK